ncbi:MAG TPA: M3 family metallopeptidase [Gammaproteobacteria bacterium]|nr:M3 family metallopeptidase [Gammaproteobacteria bacterium]
MTVRRPQKKASAPAPPRGLAFRDFDPQAAATEFLRSIEAARETVDEAAAEGGEGLIASLEIVGEDLDRRFAPLRHLNAVASTPAVRSAYETALAAFTGYETWLGQHQRLYRRYQSLARAADLAERPPGERALIAHALTGFRLSGADLPEQERSAVRRLIGELSELENRFQECLREASEAWREPIAEEAELAGIPEPVVALLREHAAQENRDGWLLTLDPGIVDAVLIHAENRALRRRVYDAWVSRASQGDHDNAPVIEAILARRRRLARALGYANFADYALVERMAKNAEEVSAFLRDLAGRARARAQQELAELSRFAAEQGLEGALAPWDISYYGERLRKNRYGLDDESLRRFFPLERVLAGLRALCRELYGLRFRSIKDASTWHPEVRVWTLTRGGETVGRLYLDLYARPGKRGGAWMDEGGQRLRLAGLTRRPMAFLNADFLHPARGRPSLLTHEDVVTLCHELGHCLHHLLTTVDYPSVAGISGVEWDAVEFPSQLHEEFAWHPAGLAQLAAEADSGAAMPGELVQALGASRRFQGALHLLRQIEFALFDLEVHRLAKAAPSIAELRCVLADVQCEVRVTPVSPRDRSECNFAHIFGGGYAAGYYSYLWAEVMARDGFAAFVDGAELRRDAGERLAGTVLAAGGSRPARELYRAFRGRDPQSAPLLAAYGIAWQASPPVPP